MKSFCLKTNNNDVIDYLLVRVKEIEFKDLIYSKRSFKKYENVIVHYVGDREEEFYEFLRELILEVIIEFYEERIINQLINYNYFYFEEFERRKIFNNCFSIMEEEDYEQNEGKQEIIIKEIDKYIKENRSMVLEGFVYFRLKEYIKYLDNIIDISVNKYIVEKEYNEFIDLLKLYIESQNSKYELVHLIYVNGGAILLDSNKNIINVPNDILKNKYLSDISFSANDVALNTLLTIVPKKIEIHLISEKDEFINTIELVFENRVSICKDCNICRAYKLLNNVNLKSKVKK